MTFPKSFNHLNGHPVVERGYIRYKHRRLDSYPSCYDCAVFFRAICYLIYKFKRRGNWGNQTSVQNVVLMTLGDLTVGSPWEIESDEEYERLGGRWYRVGCGWNEDIPTEYIIVCGRRIRPMGLQLYCEDLQWTVRLCC